MDEKEFSADERKYIEKEQKRVLEDEKARYHIKEFTEDTLHEMISNAVASITENKQQFFDMYELLMKEKALLENQASRIGEEISDLIAEIDHLQSKRKQLKQQLAEASARCDAKEEERLYTDLATVFELIPKKETRETALWKLRNLKERRIKELSYIINTTKKMVTSMGAITSYLTEQFSNMSTQFTHLKETVHINEEIINAHETERLRISRELHDSVAQDLASLMLDAEYCKMVLDRDMKEEARKMVGHIKEGLQGSISGIRQAIFDMRPMSIDDIGLVGAIHELCDMTGSRHKLSVQFSEKGGSDYPVSIPKYKEIGIYRIVQEGLRNAVKHGECTHVFVRVSSSLDALTIRIEDNGKGFDPDEMFSREKEDSNFAHYGLLGMKERAEQIGGTLKFDSKPSEGTRVKLTIPYGTVS